MLLHNDVFANGVAYLSLSFDLTGLPADLWPWLGAYADAIEKLGAAGMDYEQVRETLETVEPPVPVPILAADRYQGPPLGPGETSLTVRIVLQPAERTLTDGEIDGYRRGLIESLQQRLGLRIRE